jgi:hypothetical protein
MKMSTIAIGERVREGDCQDRLLNIFAARNGVIELGLSIVPSMKLEHG